MNKYHFITPCFFLLVVFIFFFAQFAVTIIYQPSLITSVHAAAPQSKKIYKLGMHFESQGGIGSAQLLDITNKISFLIKEKTGISFIVDNKFSTDEDAENTFISREIDAVRVGMKSVIRYKEKGINILPLFTYTIGKRDKQAWCLYQQKAKSYSPQDIIGTRLLNDSYFADDKMIALRDYLFKIGIDKPLWNVFRGFIRVPSANSTILALAMGKADFYWTVDDWDYGIKILNPGLFTKISHKFCTDRIFDRWVMVINKQSITEKDYKQLIGGLTEILANFGEVLKNDPNLKSFFSMMRTTKLEVAVAKGMPFEEEIKIWEKAKKNGWYEEAKYFCDTMNKADFGQEVNVKPDYKYCKCWCYEKLKIKDEQLKISCIDECMN